MKIFTYKEIPYDIKALIDDAMKNLWDAYQIAGANICEYSGLRNVEGYE